MGWTWIKKCPVFFLLTVSGLIFSLVGIIGRFSLYRGYEFHVVAQPFLVLVMEGIDQGVAPWEVCGLHISRDTLTSGKEAKETAAEADGIGQSIEDFAEDATNPDGTGVMAGSGAGSTGAVAGNGGDSAGTAGDVPDGRAGVGSGTDGGNISGSGADGGNAQDSGSARGNVSGPGADGGNMPGTGAGGGNMADSGADGGNVPGTSAGGENMSGPGADNRNMAGSVSDGGNAAEENQPGGGTGRMDGSSGEGGTAGAETESAGTYEFQEVPEEYFNDAVFIGDSRTVGLYEYGGIEMRADFFAEISLTIYDVFTERMVKDEETGKKITIEEALQKKQYGKVYLMLGINELGTGTTGSFMEEYTAVVERIKELQPNAVIFVEGIMRVTAAKDESDPIFNNTNINEKNDAIARLANNRDVFYIDVNEAVCDAGGNLNAEYTIDEVHLKAKYYGIWMEFLLKHGIIVERNF